MSVFNWHWRGGVNQPRYVPHPNLPHEIRCRIRVPFAFTNAADFNERVIADALIKRAMI